MNTLKIVLFLFLLTGCEITGFAQRHDEVVFNHEGGNFRYGEVRPVTPNLKLYRPYKKP